MDCKFDKCREKYRNDIGKERRNEARVDRRNKKREV